MGGIGAPELVIIFLTLFLAVGIPLFLLHLFRQRARKAPSATTTDTVPFSEIQDLIKDAIAGAVEPIENQLETLSQRLDALEASLPAGERKELPESG